MEIIVSLIQILLPAGLVLAGMFGAIRTLLQKDIERHALEVRARLTSDTITLRLGAYERLVLLLERSAAQSLLPRVMAPGMTVGEYQARLVEELRAELSHNLTQQIYVSEPAWALTRTAIEEVISVVNSAGQGLDPEAPALELARRIFEHNLARQADPSERPLLLLRTEAREIIS